MKDSSPGEYLVIWVPTPHEIVREMLALANVSSWDVVYDLGCGDARTLISAVRDFGARRAVGYEIRQELCETSRKMIEQSGLQERVRIINEDLRKADLSEASVVTLYLTTQANQAVRNALESELRPGSRVVTYLFPIPGWLAAKEIDLESHSFTEGRFIGKLYLYLMPPAMTGVYSRAPEIANSAISSSE
jgi:SAM-dependent methyltransferase